MLEGRNSASGSAVGRSDSARDDPRRRLLATVTIALWLLCGALAGQAESFAGFVAEAESLVTAGEIDRALELSLRALPIVERSPDSAARTASLEQLGVLIDAADPLAQPRRAALGSIASALLTQSQAYTRKGWHRTSLQLLEVAAEFDVSVAGKTRDFVARRVVAEHAKLLSATELAATKQRVNVFESFAVEHSVGDWARHAGGYRSPLVSGKSAILIGMRPRHEDARVRCAITLDPTAECWAGLVLGAEDPAEYFIVDLTHAPDPSIVTLTIYHYTDTGLEKLASRSECCEVEASRAPHLVEVTIRGPTITATVGGLAEVSAETVRPVHGKLGLWLSGNSPTKVPIEFRDLSIEPLPTDEASTDDPGETQRTEPFASSLAEIERLDAARDPESATLLARSVLRELADRDHAADVSLSTRLAATIARLDPLESARAVALRDASTRLTALLPGYFDAARPRAAFLLLADASRLDHDTATRARTELAARLEAAMLVGVTAPPEPTSVADPEYVRAWFPGVRFEDTASGWTRDTEHTLFAPKSRLADTQFVSPRSTESAGTLSVQIRPDDNIVVAAICGHHSPSEGWLVAYDPRDGGTLSIRRRSFESWSTVASAPARLGDAARATWATLALTYDETQLVARIGLAPPIAIARPIDFRPGRVGVCTLAGKGDGRFRNFAFVPLAGESGR